MDKSRRDFVKVLAVFGSAMALPEALRGKPLPPPQEAIILPADALSLAAKQFIWIDRIPLTESYQCNIRLRSHTNTFAFASPAVVPGRKNLTIDISAPPATFSRLFSSALASGTVEIAFALPQDSCASVVKAYYSDLGTSFSSHDADVVSIQFEAVEEPRLIPISQMPKYLAGLK